MDTDLTSFIDYSSFSSQEDTALIKRELATVTGELRKLVTLQEDVKQKNLIFERLNLIDKKLAALEGEALKEVRSDMVKLQNLSDSNKAWMGEIGKLVEYLLQREREREDRGGEGQGEGTQYESVPSDREQQGSRLEIM